MYRANKKPDGLTGWDLIVVGLETRKWATFIRMNRAPSLSRNTSWYISDWISQLPVTVGYHSSPDNRTAPASTGLQTFSMLVSYCHSPLNSGFLSDMKFPEWKSFTCLTRPSISVLHPCTDLSLLTTSPHFLLCRPIGYISWWGLPAE